MIESARKQARKLFSLVNPRRIFTRTPKSSPFSPAWLLVPVLCWAWLFGAQVAAQEQDLPPEAVSGGEQGDYLIGPGDVLEIVVWKEPDLSRTVTVRLDGKISLPLVDDIQAANCTLLDVKHRVTEALSGYVDAPAVYIMLQEARSKKIYVIGKVSNPGEMPLTKNMTLLQAISLAGGFADWAATKDIVIMRDTPKGQVRIKVDYSRAVSGKDIEQNIPLQPDDVIVVP